MAESFVQVAVMPLPSFVAQETVGNKKSLRVSQTEAKLQK